MTDEINLLSTKKGLVNTGKIRAMIIGVIMMVVLFKIAATLVPTGAQAYHNLSDTLKADTDVLGTDAAAFAGDTDDYVGWFWVLGPFLLVISVVLAVFTLGGRRRRYRR